jgi:hypothetical protein
MPEIIAGDISRAWLGALSLADAQPRQEISNLIVHIQNIGQAANIEIEGIRTRLDHELELAGCFSVSTVANTIFPSSLWKVGEPRECLFNRYRRLWPRIQSIREIAEELISNALSIFPDTLKLLSISWNL